MNDIGRSKEQSAGNGGREACRALLLAVALVAPFLLLLDSPAATHAGSQATSEVPPSWKVLPIPRCADYGSPDDFITLGKVAIVRRQDGPYHTVRDDHEELVGESTITEEELIGILRAHGVTDVTSLPDDLTAYDGYSTLILLGSPSYNRQTVRAFKAMGLSFEKWNDPHTPGDDFTDWPDLGAEGYVLKVGRAGDRNVIVLAGHDMDETHRRFRGAGTFYALQSLRQMIVADGGVVKVKMAEIADRPLVGVRGCMTGFDPREEKQWRDIAFLPRIKANQNVYWYGNALGTYNAQAVGKFRYPWTPEQIELFRRFGKYCHERFVTMVFCVNADHYNVEWAAAKTFDGTRKDPLHYDLDHEVEPEFRQMWSELGYEVHNDVDVLAAKFGQLHKAIPGAMLQIMNEDDVFGLVHDADKKRYHTGAGDPVQNARDYGRARALVLGALYRRIKALYPDSADFMPICPPGQLPYQHVLDRNQGHSREFLSSLGSTLAEQGLQDRMPVLTTGGGTHAEVIAADQIDRFRQWSNGCSVLLHENNFAECAHVGAYQTDPNGPRSLHQLSADYPAGYRDPQLYTRLWGIHWNGVPDHHVLGWCQAQYMWNMLALDRAEVNALAARKVSSSRSYHLVRSYLAEFDNPAAYLPDNQPPVRVKVISDTIAFPADGWTYLIHYTDSLRKECQRLRGKLGRLLPQLETQWENEAEKRASLDALGYSAYSFCSIYLAYGYIKGWEGETSTDRLDGAALRDLYLEADDLQQLYFAGPEKVEGRQLVNRHYYHGSLPCLYANGKPFTPPKTIAEAEAYIDIWQKGLQDAFFEPVSSVMPAQLPDDDPRLARGWGGAEQVKEQEQTEGQSYRAIADEGVLDIHHQPDGRLLIRAQIGTDATALTESTRLHLFIPGATHDCVVCRPRWFNWLLPQGVGISQLTIKAEKPVHIYSIDVYKEVARRESQ